METREQIFDELFTEKWTYEDGLIDLEPRGKKEKMLNPAGQETPRNDNGILFLAYFICIAHACGLRDRVRSKFAHIGSTIERLVRLPHRGLFNRRNAGSGTPDAYEAHDNYAGICALSVLCGFSYPKEIVSYGSLNGWNYNNMEPGKWELKSQRQGGEIALYWIAGSIPPSFIETLWLFGGLLVNAFKKNSGENMLAWLRLYIIEHSDKKPIYVKIPYTIVSEIWKFSMDYKWGGFEQMTSGYYFPDHPIRRMAKHLKGWGF